MDKLKGSLIKHGFILKSVTEQHFRQVFSGKEPPKNRIQWIGTLEQLYWFILQLSNNKQIQSQNKWDSAKACFYMIEDDLVNLDKQHKPKNYHLIDNIINESLIKKNSNRLE